MTGVICENRACAWNDKEVCSRTAIHLRVIQESGMGGRTITYKCIQFEVAKSEL